MAERSGWKINVVYREPFWRAGGLSGQVISDRAALAVVYDNSPPSGKPGVLISFVDTVGNTPAVLHHARARRDAVIGHLGEFFGPKARAPYAPGTAPPGKHCAQYDSPMEERVASG